MVLNVVHDNVDCLTQSEYSIVFRSGPSISFDLQSREIIDEMVRMPITMEEESGGTHSADPVGGWKGGAYNGDIH